MRAVDTFQPPTTGVRVFDLDRDAEVLRRAMARGVPFGAGNVLRTAIQSPEGQLIVLWTGTRENADAAPHPTVDGRSILKAFTPGLLNPSPGLIDENAVFKFDGKPLFGVVLQLPNPVGATVTLRMPILVADRRRPVQKSRVTAPRYRSRQVGTAVIRDFPVIETIPFAVLAHMNGALE